MAVPRLFQVPPDDGWAFATYRNYLAAYTHFLRTFGTGAKRFQEVRTAVRASAGTRIAPFDSVKPVDEIRRALRNAWATEVGMALPGEFGDERFIAASLHWLGPQAYYAVYQAGLAAVVAKDQPLPDSHQKFLKTIHSQYTERGMLPAPWDAACSKGTVGKGGHIFAGCLAGSKPAASTLYPGDEDDAKRVLCMALKTTRDRRFDDLKETMLRRKDIKTKAGRTAKRMTLARQNSEYEGLAATTTFDFLYRLRIRSNYRDADTFLSQNVGDVRAFYDELVGLTRCTLHALESLVVLAIGEKRFGAEVTAFGRRRLPSFAEQQSVLARWPEFATVAVAAPR